MSTWKTAGQIRAANALGWIGSCIGTPSPRARYGVMALFCRISGAVVCSPYLCGPIGSLGAIVCGNRPVH